MTSQLESEVLIIGAGIMGASIARELSQYKVNPDPALKRGALGSPGFIAFIPVINHGAFCGAG